MTSWGQILTIDNLVLSSFDKSQSSDYPANNHYAVCEYMVLVNSQDLTPTMKGD